MSTLPRLPQMMRKVGAQSQMSRQPPTALPPVNPQPASSLSSTFNPQNNTTLVPVQFNSTAPQQSALQTQQQNLQIQQLREVTMRKYEQYVSQLRALDRNFTLNMKKIDQNNTRAITRVTDSVSSLYSEMQQLKNQSVLLQRKMKSITKMMDQTLKDGIVRATKPLSDGFKTFGEEFQKAQGNVDTLFFGLENRTATILDTYKDISPITQTVKDVENRIKELIQAHTNTLGALEQGKNEINQMLEQQRNNVLHQINDRTAALNAKINILEQRSAKALDQSQNVINESQTSQFDMRKLFDESLDISMKGYKQKLESVRNSVTDLAQTRFNQIDELRNRMAQASEKLSKAKHKTMKQMVETKTVTRTSLRPEIDKLKQRCDEMEKILQEKGIQKPKKEGTRMFYMTLDDGTLKYINVLEDGSVVV